MRPAAVKPNLARSICGRETPFEQLPYTTPPPAFAEARKRGPIRPGPKAALTRMLLTKQVVHVPDVALDEGYIARDPLFVSGVEVGGFRSFLIVPMLKENEVIEIGRASWRERVEV